MAAIELVNVTKVFDGDVVAVDDVSLTVEDGEFMVLVGPSGCGKSTLLRMIAGLEEVTAGSVSIGGRDVTDLAPRHRDIAMVFQSYALYPHMTVRQNLGYGLKVRRTPKAEIAASRRRGRRAARAGASCSTDEPAQLSGGQRQRVAMGRAIVREPQAFLMDEPLSNLDAKLRVGMRASLARLHARLGVTTVYVTHDQTEAMTLGQRVAVMRDGRIVQVDEPQTLYREPVDLFVAAFIGSPAMNLVEAVIDGDHVVFGQLPRPARSGPPARARASSASSSASGPRRSRTASFALRAPAAHPGARRGGRGARRGRPRLLPRRGAAGGRRAQRREAETESLLTDGVDAVHRACRSGRTRRGGRDREPRRRPGAVPLLRRRSAGAAWSGADAARRGRAGDCAT